MVLHRPIATICLVLGILLGAHGTVWCQAAGQPSQDFYKNKQIRMIIGYPVGNDYDLAGRFLARYLAKHIPGEPTIIVQNMPSAASIAAANFLYAQAPRDGTAFGSFSRNMPSQALMGQANVEVDPRRFSWLGATSLPARVCVRWVTAPIRTPADLFTQEFIVGGAGAGSSLNILPTVFNHVLGTKFRLIPGYKGTTDTVLAVGCAAGKEARQIPMKIDTSQIRALAESCRTKHEATCENAPNQHQMFGRCSRSRGSEMRDYSGIERGELIEEIYRKEAEIERLEEVLRGVGAGDPDVCHHVRTSRVDGTRASMHFETSLADEARHGPPCGDHDLGEPSRARRRWA